MASIFPGGGDGGNAPGPSSSPATSTSTATAAASGVGGGGGSMDIPLVGTGAGNPVQAPAYEVPPGYIVEISPNPNNAADFKLTENGPQGLISGPLRTIKAGANPIQIGIENLARIFGSGAAGDYVILTVKRR